MSGSTPLAPSHSCSSFNVPDRLSCFSCGQPGHLGPDCQYRVPNYVVLSYDVMSFDLPTQNLLGKTILRQVVPSAWDTAEEMEVCSQYGEVSNHKGKIKCHQILGSCILVDPGDPFLCKFLPLWWQDKGRKEMPMPLQTLLFRLLNLCGCIVDEAKRDWCAHTSLNPIVWGTKFAWL